jgi:hypothetical protein
MTTGANLRGIATTEEQGVFGSNAMLRKEFDFISNASNHGLGKRSM